MDEDMGEFGAFQMDTQNIDDYPPEIVSMMEGVSTLVRTLTFNVLSTLMAKWRIMYEMDTPLAERFFTSLLKNIQNLYSNVIEGEESRKLFYVNEIARKMMEKGTLEKELAVTIDTDFDHNNPLAKIEEALDKSLESYRFMKAERLKRLEQLRLKEHALCSSLTGKPLEDISEVPTTEQLDQLQNYINDLEREKANRMAIFESIRVMMDQLEWLAESEFDQMVLEATVDNFSYSQSNTEKLKLLYNLMEQKVEEAKFHVARLKESLIKLYERIRESEDNIKRHLLEDEGFSRSKIQALTDEVQRCEAIKLANMKPVILAVRDDIVQMWDKLTYSDEQRREFHPFFTNEFTEDILDLHELELNNLKEFYANNKHIYELAEKRFTLWGKMEELERLANDKTRLFDNRGGKLLKEEKERRTIETRLPKMDNQLGCILMEFQEIHQTPFLWQGVDLLAKIRQQHEERGAKKENRKEQTECGANSRTNCKTPQTPKTRQKSASSSVTPSMSSRLPLRSVQSSPFRAHSSPKRLLPPRLRGVVQQSPFKAKLSPKKKMSPGFKRAATLLIPSQKADSDKRLPMTPTKSTLKFL